MSRTLTATLVLSLLAFVAVPAAGTPGGGAQVDECVNSDKGPGSDAGPPGFVADVVPDFLGELFADLPVPGFVKSAVGAESNC